MRTIRCVGGLSNRSFRNHCRHQLIREKAAARANAAYGKVAGKALKMLDDVPTEFTEPAVSATDSAMTAITPADEPVEVEQPDREDQ